MRYLITFNNIVIGVLQLFINRICSIAHLDRYLFFLSFILIIIIKCIQFPSLTYHAEMFAENGTNYFIHAYNDSLLTNFVTTDAGYLPLTQRIIAVILVKVFHIVVWYPFYSQIISIFFIAFASSIFSLNLFKKFCSSLFIRFILGVAIGLISDYELNAFINFIYYGAIILFLLLFLDKQKFSKVSLFLISLVSSIIMLSKGQFVIFLPIFFFFAIWHFKKRQFQSFIYYLSISCAGIIQLLILKANVQGVQSHQSLFSLAYFFIKTLYYYALTYRHVFLGYVTKEGTSIFSILFLFSIFGIALHKLIQQKNYALLSFFLIGNFIAICSLFLTVFALNNNINPNVVHMLMKVSPTAKAVTAVSSHQTVTSLYTDAQSSQNIFDVKHFANLRSLFISNLLIFLSGIIVLIAAIPKKSFKIFIVVFFCLTSGAFAQFRVEEMYTSKNLSFSQWSVYSQLLHNKAYCIPLNHYPFLLSQECNFLYKYLPENNAQSSPVYHISLSWLSQESTNWRIHGVILINNPNQFTISSQNILYAYDKSGNVLARARQLVPNDYTYIYFLFKKPITSVETLELKNSTGKELAVVPHLSIFGTKIKRK